MKIVVTGSCGLIGSEAVAYFDARGHSIVSIDNNMRKDFFGPAGDTSWNLHRLRKTARNMVHLSLDIRDREAILDLFKVQRPDAIIHCASQPSHDLAGRRPFDDFDVNAVGTLNLLEATRRFAAESPFVHMSTNKVYGDAPNELALEELETRWDYADPKDYEGIGENFRIDHSMHSLFGASKVAADVMTQEYGRYFDMPTVCYRCSCVTGPNHSGVELHGFLAYLVKIAVAGGEYRIFGYKGKQVRDQIHSADVVTAIEAYIHNPRSAEVYNLGGGRANSASLLECIAKVEELTGRSFEFEYLDKSRIADQICYISDLSKLKSHYPEWVVTHSLNSIIRELYEFYSRRAVKANVRAASGT